MKTLRFCSVTALFATLALTPAALRAAEDPAAGEMKNDVMLRALVDELDRNKSDLALKDMTRPYYIEYSAFDSASASVTAQLGQITDSSVRRGRYGATEVRVGSYKLDNTNFGGDWGSWGGYGGASLPIEDDYTAMRQSLWWSTDRRYKSSSETFERKKAFMESKMIADKPDDFSQESPAVYFEERLNPKFTVEPLAAIAVPLSAVFREFAAVQQSEVSCSASGGNKYLVNSEGTRVRTRTTLYSLNASATVQAADGMQLSDSFSIDFDSIDELPPKAELENRCRKLVQRLIELAAAPKLGSYTGPVLFDAKPAARIFHSEYGGRFSGGQRPVGGETSPDDFENKIEQRILPKTFNVVDDPTLTKIDDKRVRGHYVVDDEGVKAQRVSLVEKGRLKGMLMSRNPSKKFKNSNGHGRGGVSIGCLLVNVDGGKSEADLKQALIEAAKDEDLPYGVRIAALGGEYDTMSPLIIYKVFPDGHEEMVRGARIAQLGLKEFKKIKAAGDKPYLINEGDSSGYTVAAPAMLFEELDLADIDRDFDKPPIIESPVGRALADKSAAAPAGK